MSTTLPASREPWTSAQVLYVRMIEYLGRPSGPCMVIQCHTRAALLVSASFFESEPTLLPDRRTFRYMVFSRVGPLTEATTSGSRAHSSVVWPILAAWIASAVPQAPPPAESSDLVSSET